jgi:arylsulfatase A-like enzyme
MTSRRKFLQTGLSLAAGAGLSRARAVEMHAHHDQESPMTNSQKPNLLFVFADQLRGQTVGFMNQEAVRTPNLDRFAAEGVVFTNAISNHPVCTPYRASLLTGRYPFSTGIFMNDLRLPEDEVSIAEVVAKEGYDTAYVGKWHLDGLERRGFTPPGPRRQGFQYWAALNCSHQYMDTFYYRDTPDRIPIDGYEPDHQTDLTIEYLKSRKAGDPPFCLFLSWGPPHEPYRQMPQKYLDRYPPEEIRLRPNCPDWNREEIAGYYAHTTALDDNFGRVLHALEETGLAENTILVFTSDHGDMLGSHGQRKKQRPWEESILVPFLIRWPDRTAPGTRSETLLGAPDVMPTLLGLMDVAIPATVEGKNLSHAVVGEEGEEPESVLILNPAPFSEAFRAELPEWRGVRTRRWTYVRTLQGPWLLYDNQEDPYQLKNLVSDPDRESVREELEQDLQAWLKKTGDAFLPKEELLRRYGYTVGPHGEIPYKP